MAAKSKNMRISALLPTSLAEQVKFFSETQEVTQSSIIKEALELWFTHCLRKDAKALGKMKFDDLPTEDEWCAIQSRVGF